jgi:hypothetical protein
MKGLIRPRLEVIICKLLALIFTNINNSKPRLPLALCWISMNQVPNLTPTRASKRAFRYIGRGSASFANMALRIRHGPLRNLVAAMCRSLW